MTPTYRTTITQPPRPAVYGDWPTWAYPPLITQLADEYGITRPYQHQSLTATTAHDGRHVIVATGTSSGKTLGYQLPALTDPARKRPAHRNTAALSGRPGAGQHQPRALRR